MISSYMDYGALSAKVRAMYGKRLRLQDFEHMAALTDTRDVLDYLRTQPGWSAAIAPLSAGSDYVGRAELEEALRRQIRHDYAGIAHFVPKSDRAMVSFPVRMKELEDIMTALRRLKSGGEKGTPSPHMADMKLDQKALHTCVDYAGLLAAVKESIYYQPLLHLSNISRVSRAILCHQLMFLLR